MHDAEVRVRRSVLKNKKEISGRGKKILQNRQREDFSLRPY